MNILHVGDPGLGFHQRSFQRTYGGQKICHRHSQLSLFDQFLPWVGQVLQASPTPHVSIRGCRHIPSSLQSGAAFSKHPSRQRPAAMGHATSTGMISRSVFKVLSLSVIRTSDDLPSVTSCGILLNRIHSQRRGQSGFNPADSVTALRQGTKP